MPAKVFVVCLLGGIAMCVGAPLRGASEDLDDVLDEYYDKHIAPLLYNELGDFEKELKNEVDRKEFAEAPRDYAKHFQEAEAAGERMQGDMSDTSDAILDNVAMKIFLPLSNGTHSLNASMVANFLNASAGAMTSGQRASAPGSAPSNVSYDLHMLRQRTLLDANLARRTKKNWIDVIKNHILQGTGRKNDTSGSISPEMLEHVRNSFNRTMGGFAFGRVQDDNENPSAEEPPESQIYVEKTRSFYPSCDIPRNTDEEVWNDASTMNLYFSLDYANNVNIATATLRLYKLPLASTNGSSASGPEACQGYTNKDLEDDKQVRVSVYWYSRSLKKHKAVRRRLADSKMVPLTAGDSPYGSYVEFNIRPAAKAWVRGRNLGMAVVVEDVDGGILRTDKHFRHIGCHTVGNVSTPKPIPTLVVDALRSGLGHSPNDTDGAADRYGSFVPIMDVCIVELPANGTVAAASAPGKHHLHGTGGSGSANASVACRRGNSPRSRHQEATHIKEMLRNSPFSAAAAAAAAPAASRHHIRHHRQHLDTPQEALEAASRAGLITSQVVVTNQQLAEYFRNHHDNDR